MIFCMLQQNNMKQDRKKEKKNEYNVVAHFSDTMCIHHALFNQFLSSNNHVQISILYRYWEQMLFP